MPINILFDRLVGRFKPSRYQQYDESYLATNQRTEDPQELNANGQKPSPFNGAHNFVVREATFIEHWSQIIHNFTAGSQGVDPTLERVAAYANLDAMMDSSARHPPPLCHPGTRLKIGDKLFKWSTNPNRKRNMMWLHGPAGTGKSAVAQMFAERCDKNGRLGASFFFSRLYSRNDPDTVIPSLVYQLAVRNSEYKSLIAAHLADDPELLRRKTRRTQFTKLIVEPFSFLQSQGRQSIRESLLIVLDGLDECEGESAQREIIEMICEVVWPKKDFPLIWLICSRPELHLRSIFSGANFTVSCSRVKLLIDAESIADVDFYLRDGLAGIKADYHDLTTPTWPPEKQIAELSNKASGHFGFASTSLLYIGSPIIAAPMAQFDALLSFLNHKGANNANPLETLDALYTGILRGVPDDVLPTIKLILGLKMHRVPGGIYLRSAQSLCNFSQIDQTTFYRAFRKLHSVVKLPPPEAASELGLQFHHLSFRDYLNSPSRSGVFAIEESTIWLERAKLSLYWYKTGLELFHTTDGPIFNHGILPNLVWVLDANREKISQAIMASADVFCWWNCCRVPVWDEDLTIQIRNFDFRYITTIGFWDEIWCDFVYRLRETFPDDFVRTEPHNEIDLKLLEYMDYMIGPWWKSTPATFPLELRFDCRGGDYFLLGHGLKTIVCWTTGFRRGGSDKFGILNCDRPPSEERISDYHTFLRRNGAVKRGGVVANREELAGRTE